MVGVLGELKAQVHSLGKGDHLSCLCSEVRFAHSARSHRFNKVRLRQTGHPLYSKTRKLVHDSRRAWNTILPYFLVLVL
jgi:hypothetical protein